MLTCIEKSPNRQYHRRQRPVIIISLHYPFNDDDENVRFL